MFQRISEHTESTRQHCSLNEERVGNFETRQVSLLPRRRSRNGEASGGLKTTTTTTTARRCSSSRLTSLYFGPANSKPNYCTRNRRYLRRVTFLRNSNECPPNHQTAVSVGRTLSCNKTLVVM